jgi:hypothetical protein
VSDSLRRAEQLIWAGMAAVGLGLSVLVAYSWVEYLNNPGISIADGYWIGRIPWTPLGVVLVLAGTTASLLAGGGATLVRGDWVRRVLLVPVLAVPILWWLTAVGVIGFPQYVPVDPVAFAYSLPVPAVTMLVVPALAVAVLATLPEGVDLRIRWRPVHPRER